MSYYTQEDRRLLLETPLGTDVLIPTAFNGREEMSRLFRYQIDLISESPSISPTEIVGKNVTVGVPMLDESLRYFNGFVTRFSRQGSDDRFTHYRAEINPWLWFLTRTTDCRIFQNQSVPEIVKAVLADHGSSDFEVSEIQGSHPKREYCVQYRESDFNFISRLMEDEGIFYCFRHENGKHILVLADQKHAYRECSEAQVSITTNSSSPDPTDQITAWERRYEFRSGRWTHNDYNFKTPAMPLMSSTPTLVKFEGVERLEKYDYPGGHTVQSDAQSLVKLRMEEEEVPADVVQATSRCRSFFPGGRFTVQSDQIDEEDGKEFVITGMQHTIGMSGSYASGNNPSSIDYQNSFECIPASVAFRPARITPRPTIHGTQTAMVVGPAGQEIHTDTYGRIKVQFHWDRRGQRNDNSSCWIRTAQLSSGGGFGLYAVPRVGHEVVVSFLEGDPDRPLVMGCVYNAQNMPPVSAAGRQAKDGPNPTDAVGAKMQMTLRSNSLGGSGGHNEITMNDTGGSEGLFLKAQKDETHHVGNDRRDSVGVNETRSVGADQIITVGSNQTISVGSDRTDTVGATETLKVGTTKTETIGTSASETVGTTKLIDVGSTLTIKAGTSITLQCGASSIHMNQAGVITITGMMVSVTGSAMATLSAPITTVSGVLVASTGVMNLMTGAALANVSGVTTRTFATGNNIVKGNQVLINT